MTRSLPSVSVTITWDWVKFVEQIFLLKSPVLAEWSEIAPQANSKLSFCGGSVIAYSFHLPTHSSTWTPRFMFNEKRNQPLHQLWSRTVPNSETARKLGRSFSRSASSHFIHRVPPKGQKLNVAHGHHCRDSDCLFKVNLSFWLSPETMFPKILHIWILSFSKKYCKIK